MHRRDILSRALALAALGVCRPDLVAAQQQAQQQQASQQQAPADTRSPAQRLKEIKELKDAGVLSDEEYNAKRAELMKLL